MYLKYLFYTCNFILSEITLDISSMISTRENKYGEQKK
ncbi:hypothetical protein ADIARSV_4212 [Arcticibacter svalbardensis MN12-7]|uniref:Uncharacterized protein n=1 Tax=Arcticibacter svalbardensis MN12-7 TaxID=1150600 RepID=R9GMG0_9SPHI|nr:hypothetical protein ADIARSV_4212 [Arcticibacter svalbardensis MN12-7]